MRNIKLIIEYEGTAYEGWQAQNQPRTGGGKRGHRTIQAALERALRRIVGEKVTVTGSGRTDAGVHARGQTANFHTSAHVPAANILRALNAMLPRDISISSAEEVPEGFHSRFSARWKLYRYTILNRGYPSALRRNFVCCCSYPLDAQRMAKEAAVLKGTHDFRSFHSADVKDGSSVRTIRRISVKRRGDEISIDIIANGFLKNMVRTIAGTLIEIGRGKCPRGMERILEARDRKTAGPTAPARGLCLEKVWY